MLLLLICMSIFSLLGMELFGHKVKYDDFGNVISGDDPTVEG